MKILKQSILTLFSYLWKLKLFIVKSVPPQKIEKILILPRTGIGDMIMLIPFLSTLKQSFPCSELTLIVSPHRGVKELSENFGYVQKVIEYDFVENWQPSRIINFARSIKEQYDLSFSCWGFPVSMLPYIKSKYRIGFQYLLGYDKRCQFLLDYAVELQKGQDKQHDVQRYLGLLNPLNINPINSEPLLKINEKDRDYINQLLKKNNIHNNDDILIGFHPGSNDDQKEKRWQKDKFIELGKYLSKEYSAKIVIVGSSKEREYSRSITGEMGALNLAGETTILQTAALIQRCRLFVSNDTGPIHIAAAVGTPVIALFGPTDPKINGPYTKKAVIINKRLPCSPCYTPYSSRISCETIECMRLITVEEVIEGVRKLI